MNGETDVVIEILGLFAVVAWFVWLDAKRRQALVQARSELQNRLLEKFASPQDVAQFLQTEGGRRFLQGLTSEHRHTGRRERPSGPPRGVWGGVNSSRVRSPPTLVG